MTSLLFPLAYFLYHGRGDAATPLVWVINVIIYVLLAVLLFVCFKWAAAEFEIPPKIVKLVGMIIFLCMILFLLVGCAGYGVGGGLSYTDPSGATYSGNINVTKYSDGKTIVKPVRQ